MHTTSSITRGYYSYSLLMTYFYFANQALILLGPVTLIVIQATHIGHMIPRYEPILFNIHYEATNNNRPRATAFTTFTPRIQRMAVSRETI